MGDNEDGLGPCCSACGVPWVDHDGAIRMCATLQRVRALAGMWARAHAFESRTAQIVEWNAEEMIRELRNAIEGDE